MEGTPTAVVPATPAGHDHRRRSREREPARSQATLVLDAPDVLRLM